MEAEATAGAAWAVAATSAAVEVVSTAVADRSAVAIEVMAEAATVADMAVAIMADTAVGTTAEPAILADTQGEAHTEAHTAPAARPLPALGLGKDTAARATLPQAGMALTAVQHPRDLGELLLAEQAADPLPVRAGQTSPRTQWPPMVTGTPLDPAQASLPMPAQPVSALSTTQPS